MHTCLWVPRARLHAPLTDAPWETLQSILDLGPLHVHGRKLPKGPGGWRGLPFKGHSPQLPVCMLAWQIPRLLLPSALPYSSQATRPRPHGELLSYGVVQPWGQLRSPSPSGHGRSQLTECLSCLPHSNLSSSALGSLTLAVARFHLLLQSHIGS